MPYLKTFTGTTSPNPFDMGGMGSGAGGLSGSVPKNEQSHNGAKPKSTVQSLLGEHSNLVNLDDLVTSGKAQGKNKQNFVINVKNGIILLHTLLSIKMIDSFILF